MRLTFFLKWYLLFTLTLFLTGFLVVSGFFHTVWDADVTKLSFLITFLYFMVSVKCGIDIKKFEKDFVSNDRDIEFGWFSADVFLSLGMVGTIIGFILIMKDFSMINFSDLSTIQDLIKNLGSGISTALYTTLFGLVASIMTKIQYFMFESASEKHGI